MVKNYKYTLNKNGMTLEGLALRNSNNDYIGNLAKVNLFNKAIVSKQLRYEFIEMTTVRSNWQR